MVIFFVSRFCVPDYRHLTCFEEPEEATETRGGHGAGCAGALGARARAVCGCAPCGVVCAPPAPQPPLSAAMWVLKTEGPAGSLPTQYVLAALKSRAGDAERATAPRSGTVVCACACPLLRARGCAAQRAGTPRADGGAANDARRRATTEHAGDAAVRSCGRCPGKREIGRSGPKPDNTGCDGWISFPGVDKSISRNHAVSPAPAPCPCLPRLPTQGRWSRQCCSPDFRASARPIDGSLQSITTSKLRDRDDPQSISTCHLR